MATTSVVSDMFVRSDETCVRQVGGRRSVVNIGNILVTKTAGYKRAAVEVVARDAGQARDDLGGEPRAASLPPRARPPQRAAGRRRSSSTAPLAGPDDERDLPLRRLREARCELGARTPSRPPRTASSAPGRPRRAARAAPAASERSVAGSRRGDSNATTGHSHARTSSQSAASSACPPRQEADERVPPAAEAARDERGLDRRRPGQHGHRQPGRERRPDERRRRDRRSRAARRPRRARPARPPRAAAARSAVRSASLCSWNESSRAGIP